ncbi:MAG TPA: sigma-70 family RNA polymerase sigma factor [Candidatus Saccharibacteria bacterium]|nr:sigma-70 family RNA polymerase sigma factor [Candidatus Saccharibacteria bacterium]HMR38784.1 sigma-70 family RNA polymerase sigma factor [Candidatus Saccharibacteria bacterium]
MLADETEIVSRVLAGETACYGEIIERYKDALYRHAYRLVRDEDEAEDINQVAFIKAYDKLHTFDPTKKLSTWLFRIVTNTALDHLRHAKHQTPLTDELTARIVGEGISPQTSAEYAELYRAVAELRPRYQVVIGL